MLNCLDLPLIIFWVNHLLKVSQQDFKHFVLQRMFPASTERIKFYVGRSPTTQIKHTGFVFLRDGVRLNTPNAPVDFPIFQAKPLLPVCDRLIDFSRRKFVVVHPILHISIPAASIAISTTAHAHSIRRLLSSHSGCFGGGPILLCEDVRILSGSTGVILHPSPSHTTPKTTSGP